MITPDRIKAFLDDLALLSARHDLTVITGECLLHDGAPRGYFYIPAQRALVPGFVDGDADTIASLNVSTATAHQRIALSKSLADARRQVEEA